jgi:hypothetical protein
MRGLLFHFLSNGPFLDGSSNGMNPISCLLAGLRDAQSNERSCPVYIALLA